MFVIRQVATEDVTTLLKLARMVHFINLPPNHVRWKPHVTTKPKTN